MKRLVRFGLIVLLVLLALRGSPTRRVIPNTPPTLPTPAVLIEANKAGQPLTTRPNIIFILTDDMAYGDDAFMPQLNRWITSHGMTFDHYFVSSSLCCPSRATTLRGQYPHNTQVLSNNPPTGGFQIFHKRGLEKSTVATWLHDSGYRTVLLGKYLNGYPQTVKTTYVPPGWDEWYVPVIGTPYSEFDYSLNENGKLMKYGSTAQDYGTDVYARKAVDFIQRAAVTKKPFFMYLATYAPHHPATPAPRHEGQFASLPLPHPPSFNEADVSAKPSYVRDSPLLSPAVESRVQDFYHLRVESLQAVDEMVAKIGEALQAAGALDNTYLFFTSDNGFHLGQHRLAQGKGTPYFEDVHVPLFVRGPHVAAAQVESQMVANNDLAPTFAELAGVAAPAWVDGRSLASLLTSDSPVSTAGRQALLLERGRDAVQATHKATKPRKGTPTSQPNGILEPADADSQGIIPPETDAPSFHAVLGTRYVYVEYDTNERELYDLKQDPAELHNLYETASPLLIQVLQRQLLQLRQCIGMFCRAIEDKSLTVQDTSTATPATDHLRFDKGE